MTYTFSSSQKAAYDADKINNILMEKAGVTLAEVSGAIEKVKLELIDNPATAITQYLRLVQKECGESSETISDILDDFTETLLDGDASKEGERAVKWANRHLPELKEALLEEGFMFFGHMLVGILIHYKDLYAPKYKEVVYFIKNSSGLVKIGFTRNLSERLKTLVNSSGDSLEVLYTFHPLGREISEIEAILHQHYSKSRKMGEWFDIKVDLTEWKRLCESFDKSSIL